MTYIQTELQKFIDLSPNKESSRRLLFNEIDERRRLIRKYEQEIKDIKLMLINLEE